MLKLVRTVAIVGLALPLGVFGSSDSKNAAKTAKSDRKLAAKIRKAVAKDRSLTRPPGNIEVTVNNGVVTLSGMVQSDFESQAIFGDAESLVVESTPDHLLSAVRIENKLVVAPPS